MPKVGVKSTTYIYQSSIPYTTFNLTFAFVNCKKPKKNSFLILPNELSIKFIQ